MKPTKTRLDDVTVERIRMHYRRCGISMEKGWHRDRVHRLCQMLNCTPRELAALCCIKERQMNAWTQAPNTFPTHISLQFALIESAFLEATGQRSGEPIMPLNLLRPIPMPTRPPSRD